MIPNDGTSGGDCNPYISSFFKELDLIMKPVGMKSVVGWEELSVIMKKYTSTVEKVIIAVMIEVVPTHSWAQIFHEHARSTRKLITSTQYATYLEALQYYVELVSDDMLMRKEGLEKKERVARVVKEVKRLIDFLLCHKLDTESMLIGLSPSEYTMQRILKREKQAIPTKILQLKVASVASKKKTVLKATTNELIEEMRFVEGTSRGDIVIFRDKKCMDLCFARCTGELDFSENGFVNIWTDVTERFTEKVPLYDVYFLTEELHIVLATRSPNNIGKLVVDHSRVLYTKLKKEIAKKLEEYLGHQELQSDALASTTIKHMLWVFSQLANLDKNQPNFYQDIQSVMTQKTGKIEHQKFRAKNIFIPLYNEMLSREEEFLKTMVDVSVKYVEDIRKKVEDVFRAMCAPYLKGTKKEDLNEWILMYIDRATEHYLQNAGFDFSVNMEEYGYGKTLPVLVPGGIVKNNAIVQTFLRNKKVASSLVDGVCKEIGERVDDFISNCYIAFSVEFGFEVELVSSREKINEMLKITSKKKGTPGFSPERLDTLHGVVKDVECILNMTVERESLPPQERSVNDVTCGGLVINCFARLEMEYANFWDRRKNERTTSSPHIINKNEQNNNTKNITTKLHVAATEGNLQLLQEIFSTGSILVAPTNKNRGRRTLSGTTGLVLSDINIQDTKGWTPLHCAAHNVAKQTIDAHRATEVLLLLLSLSGIDATKSTFSSKDTALHTLASTHPSFTDQSGLLAAVELLLVKGGAQVFQENEKGEIALHTACMKGNVEVARALLNAGSNPNTLSIKQYSCLHYAVFNGNPHLVKLLLNYGANPDVAGPEGSPLDIAKTREMTDVVHILENNDDTFFYDVKI